MSPLKKKLILASKSPRRSQLLKEAGFTFEIRTREVEENYPAELAVEQVAPYLARKKALASKDLIQAGEILLAADSVVIVDGQIFGKPADKTEALSMLTGLSGKMHQVITGVCLLSGEKEKTFSSVSKVFFEPISREEINYYIDRFKPFDKAGSYAIQEWIGLCKISRIEGTYSNIMGLPVHLVYKELLDF